MILTRREWSKLVLTGAAGWMMPRWVSPFEVIIGLQTYSLRDRSLDEAIAAMQHLGIRSCELWEGHVEPRHLQWARGDSPEQSRSKKEQLTTWRQQLQMEDIDTIRKKFSNAGINIQAYTATFKDVISAYDLELAFKIATALGTDTITTSATVSVMKRVDVMARKYKMKVGMHNHAHVEQPNEFATPESFERGMQGLSDYIKINLDLGHFTAAGYDPIDFIRQHHRQILCLHIKDRKKQQGPSVPLGEGDTPVREVLQLLREKKWAIPANIEYDYNGADTETELKKSITYCKNSLV